MMAKRNLLWDKVVSVFRLSPVTKTELTRIGKIARDLKLKQATPEDVGSVVKRYKSKWPTMDCTPEAMMKHWDMLMTEVKDGHNRPGSKQGIGKAQGSQFKVGERVDA